MHMPNWKFWDKPKPPPEVVHEVDLVNADGTPATYPQYWKRNTLVIDLSGVSGTGSVAARLPAETTWPVRVAVRVQPGSVEQLEIQGEERSVLPVAREGLMPIDLELAPSVYRKATGAIYINWGFIPQFAEVVIGPEPESGFVSPTEVPNKPSEAAPAPGSDENHPPDVPPPPAPPPGSRKPAKITTPPSGVQGAPLPEPAAEPDGTSATDIIPPTGSKDPVIQPSPPPGS